MGSIGKMWFSSQYHFKSRCVSTEDNWWISPPTGTGQEPNVTFAWLMSRRIWHVSADWQLPSAAWNIYGKFAFKTRWNANMLSWCEKQLAVKADFDFCRAFFIILTHHPLTLLPLTLRSAFEQRRLPVRLPLFSFRTTFIMMSWLYCVCYLVEPFSHGLLLLHKMRNMYLLAGGFFYGVSYKIINHKYYSFRMLLL